MQNSNGYNSQIAVISSKRVAGTYNAATKKAAGAAESAAADIRLPAGGAAAGNLQPRGVNDTGVQVLRDFDPGARNGTRSWQQLDADAPDVGLDALDALAAATIVCTGTGRVLFANAAAEAAAGGELGIVLRAGERGVGAFRGDEGRRLSLLIAETAKGKPGGALALHGRHDARLFALVAPLPSRSAVRKGLVLVTFRAAEMRLGEATLREVFGLTPAEASLALALLNGKSLNDLMRERDVTENTLRTQLGRVLQKTETSNQRDLVLLLGLLTTLR